MPPMGVRTGVLFAFVALFGWAFGDFFIQKTTRVMGWYKTMFLIGIAGFFGLLPFAVDELARYTFAEYLSLAALSVIILLYVWALFEALRRGKISIVESVVAIELPFTVSLSVLFGGESFTLNQGFLFLIICLGIVLAATKQLDHFKNRKHLLEKGVLLAFFGSFLSALTNFYIGTFSHSISPIVVIWFTQSALAALCGTYILWKGEFASLWKDIRNHPSASFAAATLDNAAWVGYAYATSFMPISLTVTISENYIALAALLGWFFGHERIRWHQVVGAGVAFIGVAILSTTL